MNFILLTFNWPMRSIGGLIIYLDLQLLVGSSGSYDESLAGRFEL